MSANDQDTARDEILRIARGILSGEVELIAGCRKLCELRYEMGEPDNEVFLPIIGFESETDVYPLGDVRERYNRAYLAELDAEIAEYVQRARPGVLAACRRIVEAFGSSTGDFRGRSTHFG